MKTPVRKKKTKMSRRNLIMRMIFRHRSSPMKLLLLLYTIKCWTILRFLSWQEDLTSWLPLPCHLIWSQRKKKKSTSTSRKPSWLKKINNRSWLTTSMRRALSWPSTVSTSMKINSREKRIVKWESTTSSRLSVKPNLSPRRWDFSRKMSSTWTPKQKRKKLKTRRTKDRKNWDMNKTRGHLKREVFPSLTWRCPKSFSMVSFMTKMRTMATHLLSKMRIKLSMPMKMIKSEASLKLSKKLIMILWIPLMKEMKMRSLITLESNSTSPKRWVSMR